ncbi:GNAT family N-acetyltransferase [Oscillibacter sp.]|uniref:GNAT family N-acetyltransferase n=1 Tax=Oscillibacter sp. TaxID=1945593 RepID=UPI002D7F75C8|nr:GNAT family N-acetyltransferase [Oscillibacter sp.]
MNQYTFRKAKEEEVPQVFQLVLERMRWMDERGIWQWNVTDYDKDYPPSYYEKRRRRGELFVLEDAAGRLVCAAVLKERDARWSDDSPAIYLHNFVARAGESGAGGAFLRLAEEYALEKGKAYLRLDAAEDNAALAEYYESRGFSEAGRCRDGLYKGILRQKRLTG